MYVRMFFFSSRRRHTRLQGDWSSDVCSSDLVTIGIRLLEGDYRYINGLVRSVRQLHRDRAYTLYHAEVVPWLWFLTLIHDCRIFQKKTVPEIIEQVFSDAGASDFRLALYGSYPKRE